MKPLKLVFSAFGPYAKQQTLDFGELNGRNFFLIHGPTGAGKTTILDAICFALYGDSSGNLRDGKTMRSDHAALTVLTEVEFTFALGRDVYKVWRSPEQARAKKRGEGITVSLADGALYEIDGQGEKLLAGGYSNVTAKIEELLGFKSSQFRQVVLLPQGEFRKLLLANSLERQEIMQTLFKTDLYKQIEESLKEQAKAIKQEREGFVIRRDFILQELKVDSPEALAAMLEAKMLERQVNEVREKALASARQGAQQQLTDAQVLKDKFERLAKAQTEQETCQKLLPTVEEYKALYQRAEQALQLADIERQAMAAQQDYAKRQAGLKLAEAQAAQAAERMKSAEVMLRQEQAKLAEQEAIQRQLLELATLSDKVTLLQAALGDEAVKSAAAKEQLKRKETGETALAALQAQLKIGQEKLQAASLEAAKIEHYQLEMHGWQELQTKLAAGAEITAAMQKAQIAWDKAKQALLAAERDDEAKRNQVRRLQYLFTEGQAAVLAKNLQADVACPVCGSLAHPNPAACGEIVPDEAEVKVAQQQAELAEKQRQAAQQQAAKCQIDYDTLANRRKDITDALVGKELPAAELAEKIAQTAQKLKQGIAYRDEIKQLEANIAKLANEEHSLAEKQARLAQECQAAAQAWQSAMAIKQERLETLPEKYRDLTVLMREENELKDKLTRLKQALEAAQRNWQQVNDAQTAKKADVLHCQTLLQDSRVNCQVAQNEFAARMLSGGFSGADDYRAAKKPPDYVKNLAERIASFDERIIAAKSALAAAAAAVENLSMPDIDKCRADLAAKEIEYNAVFAELCRQRESMQQKQDKQKLLHELSVKLHKINGQYAVSGTLAEVANGGNSQGMTFQRFVLRSLLHDVIDAANLRLKIMSRGQYMLQGTDERARKNAAGGLEIEIFDHYTGYARPVATLSGGETFLASLSLALGLADVVQSYAGGIHLDTILVDEGFGTLDPESLDIAIRALVDLQKGGRLVGIISHVPELKERIDARLEVTKGKTGSSAAFCVS